MSTRRVLSVWIVAVAAPAFAHAQVPFAAKMVTLATGDVEAERQITESTPLEVTPVKNAPFAAQAVTEFTQILLDGNRIDRRYESSIARDSRGRTRRNEQIALLGGLASPGAAAPKLVTIVDPDAGTSYTIDDEQRVAYRNKGIEIPEAEKFDKIELLKLQETLKAVRAAAGGGRGAAPEQKRAEAARLTTTDLGTRVIEGVRTQGTRTTQTIAAGAVGNAQPIEIVSERWFSPELQMAVLITRHDPQNGDTEYRLTNIVRGEQPDALFSVPPGYEVKDGKMNFLLLERESNGKKIQAFPKK